MEIIESFDDFTFRCFSLGHIMTDPKGKSNKQKYEEAMKSYREKSEKYANTANKETKAANTLFEQLEKLSTKVAVLKPLIDVPFLSDSTRTHLADIYTRVKYGRTEDIKSKYLEKGLHMEEEAITLYSLYTGDFHKKNKERKRNEFIEGETDFDTTNLDMVIDTKVNWQIFQFNRVATRPIKPLYSWQLDGYMWLWDKKKGRLVYTLLNTPEHLIKREEQKLMYELYGTESNMIALGAEEEYREACAEMRKNHIYDDIPLKERVRLFDVTQSDERVEKIKARVIDCRKYLNEMLIGKVSDEVDEDDEAEAA